MPVKKRRFSSVQILGLLILTSLGGCDSSSESKFQYEIFDSGVTSNVGAGDHVAWLDNETVLFTSRYGGGEHHAKDVPRINRALRAWNYKTGQFDMLSAHETSRFCLIEGILHYRRNRDVYRAKPIKENGRYRLTELAPLPEGAYFKSRGLPECQYNAERKENFDLYRRLDAFDAEIRKRWAEVIPDHEKRGNKKYQLVFVSKEFPEGKLLTEMARGGIKRYTEHNKKYLVRRTAPHVPNGTAASESEMEWWTLSQDGNMEKLNIPFGWSRALMVYLSAIGPLVASDNPDKGNGYSARGIYHFSEDGTQITELIAGYSQSEALSPDGCKLAFSHKPKILPLGQSKSSLKVIDLCLRGSGPENY